jgi:hypothetical protein
METTMKPRYRLAAAMPHRAPARSRVRVHPSRASLGAIVLVAALALGACGSDDSDTSSEAATDPTAAGASVAPTAPADGAATTDPAEGATATTGAASSFDVNTASQEEIASVLSAAGVPNSDQWAREVVEYRPYDLSDPTMAHLRDELAKYNPAEGVVDQIVDALQP